MKNIRHNTTYDSFFYIIPYCRVPSGRNPLMSERHGTAPSVCTVLLIVSPLRGIRSPIYTE